MLIQVRFCSCDGVLSRFSFAVNLGIRERMNEVCLQDELGKLDVRGDWCLFVRNVTWRQARRLLTDSSNLDLEPFTFRSYGPMTNTTIRGSSLYLLNPYSRFW